MTHSHDWKARFFAILAALSFLTMAGTFGARSCQAQAAHFSADASAMYRKASQETPESGVDVIILEDEATYTFDAAGLAHRSSYIVYRIVSQRGAEGSATISLGWEPWHEERPTIQARVITPDNLEHPLDISTISEAPAKAGEENVFSDQRVLRAPLPAISPGAIVEEEINIRQSAPFFGAGTVERYYFGRRAPVKHTRLILDAPSSLPLQYREQLLPDVKPQRTESQGRVRIIFESGPIQPLDEAERDLPSNVSPYPNITFSTGKSWQYIAGEYSKIVDRQIAGADLKSIVEKLTVDKPSREAKAEAILEYIDSAIRYTGVEFANATIVPRSPAETLTRKYGDCKDKAALMVAMFRAAGLPAYVALLKVGAREDLSSELPGMGMFDHAIVYVPGDVGLWIDPTDEYARLSQIPIPDQGRLALVARPESQDLIRIPVTTSAENVLYETREIRLAENGPAHVVETTEPRGALESSYRRTYIDKDNNTTKINLTKYMKSQYLADSLDRLETSDPKDFSRQFQLTLESDHAKRGFTDLEVSVAAIRLEGIFNRLPSYLQEKETEIANSAADHALQPRRQRAYDYQIANAFVTEWQYTIIPPPGFRPKALPKDAILPLGPASLSEKFSGGADNVVHATIRFDMAKREISVPEATDLRNGIAQLREGEAILIYFEPVGTALLHEGKVGEALQSYRDLIALHPAEAVHHLQIARALLEAGLGETARSEANVAIRLEPNSSLAQTTLAEILEYDSVGRKFRSGSDYAGAEIAYRAAEKLDPADKATVANLAILLEYNRWGLRYGPGAKLNESVAEYRKLSAEDQAGLGVSNNLAFTLFYAGRFSEARKSAESLNPQPIDLIVACESIINGSQAGLGEARKLAAAEDKFREIVETAGQMLVNIRKYSLAADLLDAGASGGNASDIAADAATYRKTQLHEQIHFAENPTDVALQFELLGDDPDLTVDQLKTITSRNGNLALATAEVADDLVKEERGYISSQSRSGTFPDVGMDTSITKAQPKVEGNNAVGYKITLWPSADYKRSSYVVKEDGKYKVLATSQYPIAIGLEILDRVEAHDLTGARVLLDWLREDLHLPGGEDPLNGAVFPRFWTKGKSANSTAMKLAAASILIANEQTAARGVAILESAKPLAVGENEKNNIEFALIIGYVNLREFDRGVPNCAHLEKAYLESRVLFHFCAEILASLGRLQDLEKLTQGRLQRIPGDLDAMRELAYLAAYRGDMGKAHALSQEILRSPDAEPLDLNWTAWLSLFTGKVDSTDIEDALKAAQLSGHDAGVLHTLGSLYAEVGKTKEARDVLVQAMDSLNLDEPDGNYWYAFGRIAEQYGERDAAIANYMRVPKPKYAIETVDSSYRLAQLRLQAVHSQKP